MARPLRIGLTGGIASGKTTVSDIFAELGVPVIDTDVIARDVVQRGTAGLNEVGQAFGTAVIAADGTLDRKQLRNIVFSDAQARRRLEAILHPRIRAMTEAKVEAETSHYLIIVVPLLVESPMKSMMDRILVVDCSEQLQIQRLMNRDVETEEQARRIMATQASRAQRLAIADDVITNNDELADTRQQVVALHDQYLRLSPPRNS